MRIEPTGSVRVRGVLRADLPAMEAILDATALFPSALLADMVAPLFDDPSCRHLWLVAEREGAVVAFAYCEPERMTVGTWNLLAIAVLPSLQRRGIGALLIRRIERLLADGNERILLVETLGTPDFASTRLFYRTEGYTEEARIRDYYEDGGDKVVFRKRVLPSVRAAEARETALLQALERDAAQSYVALAQTAFCATAPVRTDQEHALARQHGVALVMAGEDRPIGFLLAVPKDGRAHLLELAVARSYQGRGYGRRLIAAFETWASQAGFDEATLTTFKDVPWNAPFYGRLGYEHFELQGDRPELANVVREERDAGFHRAPRVVMRKRLYEHAART